MPVENPRQRETGRSIFTRMPWLWGPAEIRGRHRAWPQRPRPPKSSEQGQKKNERCREFQCAKKNLSAAICVHPVLPLPVLRLVFPAGRCAAAKAMNRVQARTQRRIPGIWTIAQTASPALPEVCRIPGMACSPSNSPDGGPPRTRRITSPPGLTCRSCSMSTIATGAAAAGSWLNRAGVSGRWMGDDPTQNAHARSGGKTL